MLGVLIYKVKHVELHAEVTCRFCSVKFQKQMQTEFSVSKYSMRGKRYYMTLDWIVKSILCITGG